MWYIYSYKADDFLDIGGYETEDEAWAVIERAHWRASDYEVIFKEEPI